ncbi:MULTISPECIES: phosphonate C-P lyase system protein PhnG [Actibacterium]|uniref:Alpha-D-ribose 1-methylphosphonate 5-triphosphate synthase subunit PhnG n=1 Tax=Actibacterium naphthalenivorans TaxID=1614693 RepID=A0A840CAU9_9RHOB|nr:MULTISPECIES: phosphonate C-P lyase system protein PhnG [Actibacterium]ALG90677.1 phosphonate metabolism protein PhnG [Actibacterium sp. EMB200-NS6]MBB4023131.1 alpha-D-ribose 1-methylphosphonate 5-triphosphate synthase subunit PhnG [Actibacterium naphthalenivorans]
MKKIDTRQGWMGLLAKAPAEAVGRYWAALGMAPAFTWLRTPEIGGVMVRGRMGGTGAPFNMGEMTVTRCALRLEQGGAIGHAYVQGRDKAKAEQAALLDALMQTGDADSVRVGVLEPLAAEMEAVAATRAAKAAATKVDFFTMVRGED